MFLSDILAYIGQIAVAVISGMGYIGIFILMVLESMVFPVPSELVMPFAGYLIAQGTFTWAGVLITCSLGSLVGSVISYYIGFYAGDKVVRRYGKYALIEEEDLEKTEKWFKKRGELTIFIARFIPVVRHIISIPAGMAKMDKKKFIIYTLLGAMIWNMFLAYLGYQLGKNWNLIRHYSEPISIVVVVLLVAGFVYFVYKHILRKRSLKR